MMFQKGKYEDEKKEKWDVTYKLSSSANESRGDKVPDVSSIDRTPIFTNSCMASPGLKHHQLSILETLPTALLTRSQQISSKISIRKFIYVVEIEFENEIHYITKNFVLDFWEVSCPYNEILALDSRNIKCI